MSNTDTPTNDYEAFVERFHADNVGAYEAMTHYMDHILFHINNKEGRGIISARTNIPTRRLKAIYQYPFDMSFIEANAILKALNKNIVVRRTYKKKEE